jgi:uncharacterized membrane protein SpoIIM required for sporulation
VNALKFEADHAAQWTELATLLDQAEGIASKADKKKGWDAARLALLYRAVCEQLALAQARAYPMHLTDRLEGLAHRAHRQIYRPRAWTVAALGRLVLVDFPQAVRAHRGYVLAATLLFMLPLLVAGWAAWRDPGFILPVMDASGVQQFDRMYGDDVAAWGRERDADTDWKMFGYYIKNNIGVGFQCFAAGIFAGIGSAFYLVYNGLLAGVVGGYLVSAGKGGNFFAFVVTHAAFELTAIVLAGAAGLRLGHAWLAPGRRTRVESLRVASRGVVTVMYGVVGMLLVAAAIEAFWSSARWVEPAIKYGVALCCWTLVLVYLGWQGRPAASASSDVREHGHAG